MTYDPFNFAWLDVGKVAVGSIPNSMADIHVLHSGLNAPHLFAILSLTRASIIGRGDITTEATHIPPLYIDYHQLAVEDGGLPDVDRVLSCVASYNQRGCPVYIHCRGGHGRTGAIAFAYARRVLGWSIDDTVERLRSIRPRMWAYTDAQRAFFRELGYTKDFNVDLR